MKSYLPVLACIVLFTSCSTAYKTGQTPDDVYYSPQRESQEYVRTESRDEQRYDNDETVREDRYLRMKTRYRRYAILDNEYDTYYNSGSNYYSYTDYFRNNHYGYYNNQYWNTGYAHTNPYYYNPYYSNPYYSGYASTAQPVYNKPRTGNLNIYSAPSGSANTPRSTYSSRASTNTNSSTSSDRSGGLRDIFSGSNSSSSTPKSTPSSAPSSSSSSSGSSSSGSGSAPVRRF